LKISGGGFQRSSFKPYASQIGAGNQLLKILIKIYFEGSLNSAGTPEPQFGKKVNINMRPSSAKIINK
jgi:hypothetical protein